MLNSFKLNQSKLNTPLVHFVGWLDGSISDSKAFGGTTSDNVIFSGTIQDR